MLSAEQALMVFVPALGMFVFPSEASIVSDIFYSLSFTVSGGSFTATVPAHSAVAIHTGATGIVDPGMRNLA